MIDLGRELPFNALSIYMAENRPRLYHGDISVVRQWNRLEKSHDCQCRG